MGFWQNLQKAAAIGGITLLAGGVALALYFGAWIVALISLATTGEWALFAWLLFASHMVWVAGRHFIHQKMPQPSVVSFILVAALKVLVDLAVLQHFWLANRPVLTAFLALGTLLALGIEAAREALRGMMKSWSRTILIDVQLPPGLGGNVVDHGDHVHVGNQMFPKPGARGKQMLTPPQEFTDAANKADAKGKQKPGVHMPGAEKLPQAGDEVSFMPKDGKHDAKDKKKGKN